jgi:hypothetical protein
MATEACLPSLAFKGGEAPERYDDDDDDDDDDEVAFRLG